MHGRYEFSRIKRVNREKQRNEKQLTEDWEAHKTIIYTFTTHCKPKFPRGRIRWCNSFLDSRIFIYFLFILFYFGRTTKSIKINSSIMLLKSFARAQRRDVSWVVRGGKMGLGIQQRHTGSVRANESQAGCGGRGKIILQSIALWLTPRWTHCRFSSRGVGRSRSRSRSSSCSFVVLSHLTGTSGRREKGWSDGDHTCPLLLRIEGSPVFVCPAFKAGYLPYFSPIKTSRSSSSCPS